MGRLPDVVVRPADEDELAAVVRAAIDADAVVIPFGGGTNISGSLEAPADEERDIVSVDLGRMDQVLAIDDAARLARVQPGAFGPRPRGAAQRARLDGRPLPRQLQHSTLGGWIATRSSGMQSDKYGDIADMTRAVRVVTPAGVLVTRPVPHASTGPSVREMVLGSEGRLGIISEATVQVHRLPEQRVILGYLFPDWPNGLAAMHDIAASEASPSVTRVSDAYETAFSFATRKDPTAARSGQVPGPDDVPERRRNFDLEAMCLSFIGYEGSRTTSPRSASSSGEIVKRHGGLSIGAGPGELYDQKKFDTPYIRDYLLDRGALADVSETAAPWSALPTVYGNVMAPAQAAFDDLGVHGYIMCHLSHSYHSGACLYFTFGFKPSGGRAPRGVRRVKSAIQQTFVDSGATLSHHHAVGTEHASWLEQDISAPGVAMLRALFDGIDPGANLNPGKIVSSSRSRV